MTTAFDRTPQPDSRLMERLTARIRSRDGSPASWIAGGEALALGLVGSLGRDGAPMWADDLADTMVGALLRVMDRSMDEATLEERVGMGLAATVLSVARPHCTSVLDGSVDAWLGWTPERAGPQHGEPMLEGLILLYLLRDELDGAAHAAWALSRVDETGLGMILHDWCVARIQSHGPEREAQCFHALRASLHAREDQRPGLLLCAAAVAITAGGQKRREVLPWLRAIAEELEQDGTARVTPMPVRRR